MAESLNREGHCTRWNFEPFLFQSCNICTVKTFDIMNNAGELRSTVLVFIAWRNSIFIFWLFDSQTSPIRRAVRVFGAARLVQRVDGCKLIRELNMLARRSGLQSPTYEAY